MGGRPGRNKRRETGRRQARGAGRRGAGRRALTAWAAGAAAAAALIAVVAAVNSGSGGGRALVRAGGPVLGSRAAPVTVIEYGDFKCPFCTRFFAQTEPRLRAQFIDTGKVRLVWRDFVNIDAESLAAAQAARCAGAQHRFWPYHDALYGYIWNNFYGRGLDVEGRAAYTGHYDQLAAQAGLDVNAFRACTAAGTYRDPIAAAHDAAASQGVSGTPTFFINGRRLVGAQPYEVFRRLIEAQLGGS